MATQPTCEECGAELPANAPQGLCPRCLAGMGLSLAGSEPAHVSAESENRNPKSEIGSKVRYFGDYELLEEIARGGMGIVYRARQVSLNRIVAVKMLLFGKFSSDEFVKRFQTEAQAVASLQHPNIVAIHEVGEHEGQHYFSMDYIEGKNLADLVGDKPLPAKQAAAYLKTVAEAIHYAHQHGVLHRDLKPSNVLIDEFDQPRITDFGLAKQLKGDSELTVTGQVLGSPNYMPPEQAERKRGEVSPPSDVYSLGAILYHLLTGRPPFVAETLEDTLLQLLNTEPISPRLLNLKVPRDLETICLKCLEKESAKRYQTAQQLAEELNRFLNDEPIQASPVGRVERVWRWCRRKPIVASLGAATSLLLLAVAIGSPIVAARLSRARDAEAQERQRAEGETERARLHAYAGDIANAHQALLENDLGRARQLLSLYTNAGPLRALRGFEWGYLWHAARGREKAVIGGHTRGVHSIQWSRGLDWFLSTSSDRTLRRWNSRTLQCEEVMPVPVVDQNGAALAPDARKVALWGPNGLIVFDLAQRKVLRAVDGFFDDSCFQFSADGAFLVGGGDGVVQVIEMNGTNPPTRLPGATSPVALSPDGSLLASRSRDGLRFWSTRTWKPVLDPPSRQLDPSLGWRDLAFSPDGDLIAAGTSRGHVWVWTVASTNPVAHFTNQAGSFIFDVKFSPDGAWLASAAGDQTVWLWPTTNWTEGRALIGHESEVWCLQFSEDSQTLLTGSKDTTLRAWNVAVQSEQERSRSSNLQAVGVPIQVVSGDNDAFVVTEANAKTLAARQVSLHSGQTVAEITFPKEDYADIEVSPDAHWVVAILRSGQLTAWDFSTGKRRTLSVRKEEHVTFKQFVDPDHFFTVNQTGQAVTWSVPELIARPLAQGCSNIFSASSRHIFTQPPSDARTLEVRDVSTGNVLSILRGHQSRVVAMALAPDGCTVATGSWDSTVRIWGLPEGEERQVFRAQRQGVYGLALSPDGRTLAAAGADGTVTLWHLATGQKLLTLPALVSGCSRVMFTRKTLAAWCSNRTWFWSAADY